jgi:hypothetical protein
MTLVRRIAVVALTAALLSMAPLSANAAIHLQGSFDVRVLKPTFTGHCPPGVDGDQCGVLQLNGLGPADFTYLFGPTFEPTGQIGCFYVDGTFTLTLESDGSSVAGPLTGVFCEPGYSGPAGGKHPWGNPFSESDTITFTRGTGQFSGLSGVGAFHQSAAGAVYRGTLEADLST